MKADYMGYMYDLLSGEDGLLSTDGILYKDTKKFKFNEYI